MCRQDTHAPGKVAPQTAGKLIAEAVMRIIEERAT